MTRFVRIVAIAFGIGLFLGLMWLIWEKFALNVVAGTILSAFSLLFSIIIGALFAEHLYLFLTKNDK
jgi:hypothetical protein